MPDSPLKGLYTIPRGHDFLCELARGILAHSNPSQPEQLAHTTILLPNRRALRSLRDAFLQQAETRALLLPKMITVGDIDTEELLLGSQGMTQVLADLPPVISGLERQWQLSEFIIRRSPHLARAQALRQACDLASLLDRLQAFEKTEADLQNIISDRELATHWEDTLQFLSVINHVWPDYLAQVNQIDPAMQRSTLLHAQAEIWRTRPVSDPVIIAGDISAQVGRLDPATQALMESVLQLPQGSIVLPAYDRDMSAEEWAGLDSVHPDYLVREIINNLRATRPDVQLWPSVRLEAVQRQLWLREAMRPADNTTAWQQLQPDPLPPEVLSNMSLVTCATEQEEAQSIALIIREALETAEQTISLVTPDRHLARLVTGQLKRWNINVDDSAGVPLQRTSHGIYLLLIIAACQPRATVFDGLALGKHILLQMGLKQNDAHRIFREIERLALRETFIGSTLAAWQRALTDDRIYLKPDERNRLLNFFEGWLITLQPLRDLLAYPDREVKLANIIDHHLSVAEQLAATDIQSGAETLWQGPAGNCAASCFYKIRDQLGERTIRAGDYADLLNVWFTPENVRLPYEMHPRVRIYGLIEARMQQADIIILGSLNEGVWPELPSPNPFLSRRMMQDLQLPDPESKIGQSAHDFMNAVSAKRVYLTRAERVQNVPTVPARWLLRMNAVLTNPEMAYAWQRSGQEWPVLARLVDKPEGEIRPMMPPAPTPPRSARPRELSATQIEQWLRDPYGLYARKILSLRRLQKLQTLPTDAQRGQLVHAALENFTRATLGKSKLYPADHALLIQMGQAELQRYADQPDICTLWQSYLNIAADWFFTQEEKGRMDAIPAAAEIKGSVQFVFGTSPFVLTARADRIDRTLESALNLIDYKTGTAPNKKQMQRGAAAQLALEALLVQEGGFDKFDKHTNQVAYWQIPGRADTGKIVSVCGDELQAIIEAARQALEDLVVAFDNDKTPYLPTPLPDRMPRYNDYAHLERTQEWAFAENGDEAGEALYG